VSQNVFDKASRFAAKLDPPGFLSWLLGLPPDGFAFRGWRSEYAGLALVFAEKAGRMEFWGNELKEWNMTESIVVNRWIAEGEAKGRVEGRVTALLEILGDKFQTVPSDLETAIRAVIAEDRLKAWISAAVKAASLDQFRQQTGL
jgi:hypothetical protein